MDNNNTVFDDIMQGLHEIPVPASQVSTDKNVHAMSTLFTLESDTEYTWVS